MNYKPRVATGLFPLLRAAGVVHAHLESKLDAVDLSLPNRAEVWTSGSLFFRRPHA
jgi:hypothetical protein